MLFTVHYSTHPHYDQRRTYPQCYNKYARSRIVDSLEEVAQVCAEITAKGYKVKSVYDRTGKKVHMHI